MNSYQANVQPKKLFEPANREELLRGWLLHAHKCRDRHELAARRNDTYRYGLGVPTIVFATVVGSSVFASLDAQVDPSLKIILGLVSITSAVLASLQTFYNFADRAETHRVTSMKYKAMIRELEQLLTGSARQLPEKSDFLNDLRQRLNDLEAEAPVVADRIYRLVEERYTNVEFEDKAADLANHPSTPA
jgi:hypothetical protein